MAIFNTVYGGEWRLLPSTYQEVEWIWRNWNNYINTNWTPDQATWFKAEIWFKVASLWTRAFAFWNYTAGSWYYWSLSIETNASNKVRVFSSDWYNWKEFSTSNTISSSFNDIICTANWTNASTDLNWTTTSWTIIWTASSNTAYLFIDRDLRWTTFGTDTFISYFKAYNYENGNFSLVRDMVPCYRKSDSVIWMYDLVWKQFYINAGSWTFTKWPDVN